MAQYPPRRVSERARGRVGLIAPTKRIPYDGEYVTVTQAVLEETPHRAAPAASGSDGKPCDGVIWFGNVDWWYHNRGHASVRMATRIARHVPTVWVNSICMRTPIPGRTEMAWRRYGRKLKSLVKGLRRDPETGMYVYSPWFVPRYSPRMNEFNGWLLAKQVQQLRRYLGMKSASACLSIPTMVPGAERLPWVRVVFDRCDDFTTLPEVNAPVVSALEQRVFDLCHHAVYVNVGLYERERNRIPATLIGHGVDFEQFAAARPLDGPRVAAPRELANLSRPIIGFYGGMDDFRMDRELMIKVARHVRPGTLVLIGPAQMDLRRVKAEPNVVHIGQLPPSKLPRYASQFDVGIIPFHQNDFNQNCNPTKLKEYLALSFPIVAMRLVPFELRADLIYLADSHEEFLARIDQALSEDDPRLRRARREAVAGESWNKIARKVGSLLNVAMP